MDTSEFTKSVKQIPTDLIEPSPENPRGVVEEDASFERLVSSISEVGILVPIVVRALANGRYQLVDGERRFRAAKRLRHTKVPAHILSGDTEKKDVRKWMFHLHMTREQWGPLAQCKALGEMYPDLEAGVHLETKQEWIQRIALETWMNKGTARDRVHVLAWSRPLKEKIYEFHAKEPERDIYSYVLAIEVSIVEPSTKAFKNFYDHGHSVDKRANEVRAALLKKTTEGMAIGVVRSRDQIRSLEPLFKANLADTKLKAALKIFADLVQKSRFSYDDAVAQIESSLPELLAEQPPRAQKLIGSVISLTETLKGYRPEYLDTIKPESTRKKKKLELSTALAQLAHAATDLKGGIN